MTRAYLVWEDSDVCVWGRVDVEAVMVVACISQSDLAGGPRPTAESGINQLPRVITTVSGTVYNDHLFRMDLDTGGESTYLFTLEWS